MMTHSSPPGRFDLPRLGVGVGYRREAHDRYFENAERIDWLELIAEHYLGRTPERLEAAARLRQDFALIPHGIELSIGTDEPLDLDYARHIRALVDATRCAWYSDHLCFTKAGGIELGQLTPLLFTHKAVRRISDKAKKLQDVIGVPLLLENITYYFRMPGEMGETEFLSRVVTEADCGILLDLTNLYINSQNHGYDPFRFLDQIPLDRVVQVHLAGGVRQEGLWLDTHSHPVDNHPQVWELLRYLVERSPVRAVLLERDENLVDDFSGVMADLDHARAIMDSAGPSPADQAGASPG